MLPTYNPETQVPCERKWLEALLKYKKRVDEDGKTDYLPALFGFIDSAKTILKYK